jgi:redox-regulated HSP33 family molecular chaperone
MMDDGELLEITCDYCRTEYRVPPAELQGLLQRS